MQAATSDLRHEVRVRLINPRETETPLVLEPWGEMFTIAAGEAVEVLAEGPVTDTIEVAFEDGSIFVWGWPGSSVRLIHGDTELGSAARRPAVPTRAE